MKSLFLAIIPLGLLVACNPQAPAPKENDTSAPAISGDMPEAAGEMDPSQKAMMMGRAFMDERKSQQGIITTDSGLQYQVLASGDKAGQTPAPGQIVCVHYRGSLISGEEFDSSYSRGVPAAFPSNALIPGWVEALGMMRAGDKWELVIPSELAYGASGTPGGPIGPNEVLVFDVELLKVMDLSMEEYMQTYRMDMSLDCSKD